MTKQDIFKKLCDINLDCNYIQLSKLADIIATASEEGGGGGGEGGDDSDITEITAENKDAAIAASTNLVFKYGMPVIPKEDYYELLSNENQIAVYANIEGNDVPLPIDYLYDFLEHLSYICVMNVYKTIVEGESEDKYIINAPDESFVIKVPEFDVPCSYNGYFIANIYVSSRKYVGEEAEYNDATFKIDVIPEDGSYVEEYYIKDDDAVEHGLNNILKVYSSPSPTPGPGCLTDQVH